MAKHLIKEIKDLAKDIKDRGLLEPIQVRKLKKQTGMHEYELIDGFLRIEACKLIGKRSIYAEIIGE